MVALFETKKNNHKSLPVHFSTNVFWKLCHTVFTKCPLQAITGKYSLNLPDKLGNTTALFAFNQLASL